MREGAVIGSGAEPEPWAEGVGAGVAADAAHHGRKELLLLLLVDAAVLMVGGGHG